MYTDLFLESIIDTLKIVPWLFLAYLSIEIVEHYYGRLIRDKVQNAGKMGPVIGALAGVIPQCNFSVVGAALYGQRLATIGTLLAVFIATSDEAIPVILSQPEHLDLIVPLLLTKLVLAISVGLVIDFLFRKRNADIERHIEAFVGGHDEVGHDHKSIMNVDGCCGHEAVSPKEKLNFWSLFFHPIIHTVKISAYLLVVSFLIGYMILTIGESNIQIFLEQNYILQPVFAALFGLIPNCAVSVAITQFYLDGVISFGSVIAGLSASGGLGILVLFREEKDKREVFKIIATLLTVSILAGLLINLFS